MAVTSHRLTTVKLVLESILFASIPAVADVFLPGPPGYPSLFSLPYLAVFPVFAAFYPPGYALAAGILACAEGVLLLRLEAGGPMGAGTLSAAIGALSLFFLVAFIRSRLRKFRTNILQRYRRTVHRLVGLEKKNEVVERVNKVLENRVSAQKDSITLLHEQVKKIATLSLDQALETILETSALFTEMSAGAIWTLSEEGNVLVPATVLGWNEEDPHTAVRSMDTTIEGYVFRNRKTFSVRMLLEGSEYDRFSTERNVMTLPLVIGGKAWGVLNVEDLPFERYSQYTESILAILLSLSEPYLRRIIEYESMKEQQELDPDTGYPLFSILYRSLEQDLARIKFEAAYVSLIIIEIANYRTLRETWSQEQIKRMLFALKNDIDTAKRIKTRAFHHKEDSQLALLVSDLDQDGTSFFCLDLLAMFSEYHFAIDKVVMPVELTLGFSSSAAGNQTADSLIETAEYLLSMQRI